MHPLFCVCENFTPKYVNFSVSFMLSAFICILLCVVLILNIFRVFCFIRIYLQIRSFVMLSKPIPTSLCYDHNVICKSEVMSISVIYIYSSFATNYRFYRMLQCCCEWSWWNCISCLATFSMVNLGVTLCNRTLAMFCITNF